jgi:hypothetical protein
MAGRLEAGTEEVESRSDTHPSTRKSGTGSLSWSDSGHCAIAAATISVPAHVAVAAARHGE